jgi:hypothetical protein
VTIEEIVRGIRLALGLPGAQPCPSLDENRNGQIDVDELVRSVAYAVGACP